MISISKSMREKMRIPRKEIEYFIGSSLGSVREITLRLKSKGVPVNTKMTTDEIFEVVREEYKKRHGQNADRKASRKGKKIS